MKSVIGLLILPQQMLPVICQVSGEFRNSAPVYRLHLFSGIKISQGSEATLLRCGGILNYRFIAHFIGSVPLKEF